MPDPNDPAASVLATGQAGRMSVAYLRALYGVGQAWAIDYVHITFTYVCYSYSCVMTRRTAKIGVLRRSRLDGSSSYSGC